MNQSLRNIIVIILLLFAGIIYAGNTGKISGTVKDKDTGEALPFANVMVDGTSLGAASDIDGNFTILNIPPGIYSVTASVLGYQKQSYKDVRVNVDFTTRLNFTLESGSIEMEAVIVRGERNPLIRQDLTNPQVAITKETIDQLPIDQISDVIKLTAGVTVDDDGSIHIRGGFGNEISYTLNGVSLNDPYGNNRSVGLATNAVQEVSLSAGTFSAEYGNALSGVVNYVTKEGGDKYSFSLRGYAGDFVSDRTDLLDNIDAIDPLNRGRMEATFGGPIPGTNKKLKVFASGVYENFKGNIYGKRIYNPSDSYLTREAFNGDDPRNGVFTDPYFFNPYNENSNGLPTGDGAIVPMNTFTSYNFQANISYRLSSLVRLKYEAVYNSGESRRYSRAYKFNPDGQGKNFSDGVIHTFDFIHTINDKIFYTLKASYGYNQGKRYLYENVDDPRYLPSLYRRGISTTGFLSGGTDNSRFRRTTKTMTLKGDMVAQLFDNHEIKVGFETRFHELFVESYSVQVRNADGSNIITDDLLYDSTLSIIRYKPNPNTEPSLITTYKKYPVDAAIYVQDKIELAKTLILNLGLRYEYFDPKSDYNPNVSEDLQHKLFGNITQSNIPSTVKHQLSPRISVSFPITDRGVIRFSYGHFYQNGSLASLYRNHDYYVTNVGSVPTFGDPNVNLQKSVQYEMGLQQALTDDFKFDLTGYYKDVRDYIYTQTVYTATGREYRILTNLAYTNVRGITLSFYKRRSPGSLFDARVDYTFQIAEGNRTYPTDELFFSEVSGKQTETYLVPIGFDRQHVINASIGLTEPGDWSAGIIGNIQTGTPYTPILPTTLPNIITYEQNSGRQTLQWNVDLKFEKYFTVGDFRYSVFVQVNNMFDTQNELFSYASSGRALSAVEETSDAFQFQDIRRRIEKGDPGLFGIDQIDGYYSKRPERVNRPREVRLGFTVVFN